jgi:hypothetical protein
MNDTIPSSSEVFFFVVALIRIKIIVILSTQVVFIMRAHVKKTRFPRTTVRKRSLSRCFCSIAMNNNAGSVVSLQLKV